MKVLLRLGEPLRQLHGLVVLAQVRTNVVADFAPQLIVLLPGEQRVAMLSYNGARSRLNTYCFWASMACIHFLESSIGGNDSDCKRSLLSASSIFFKSSWTWEKLKFAITKRMGFVLAPCSVRWQFSACSPSVRQIYSTLRRLHCRPRMPFGSKKVLLLTIRHGSILASIEYFDFDYLRLKILVLFLLSVQQSSKFGEMTLNLLSPIFHFAEY